MRAVSYEWRAAAISRSARVGPIGEMAFKGKAGFHYSNDKAAFFRKLLA
jgi:hypothetical protein